MNTGYTVRPNCGSYSGYQMHLRHKEVTCPSCRAANTERMRERRETNPRDYVSDTLNNKIKRRALTQLGLRHPKELKMLLLAEWAKERANNKEK